MALPGAGGGRGGRLAVASPTVAGGTFVAPVGELTINGRINHLGSNDDDPAIFQGTREDGQAVSAAAASPPGPSSTRPAST